MSEYDTVLFDSDGILVAPPEHEAQIEAARAAFHELGADDVSRDRLDELVADPTAERVRRLAAAHDLDPAALWAARERHDEKTQLTAFKNGRRTTYDDVTAIAAVEGKRGVVSNNHHSTIEFVLEFFDLGPLFETYYGRGREIECLAWRKPNPHYIERALSALNADSESVLYVGDSQSDVVAADRAGLDSAFVRRPHRDDLTLSVSPTYEVDDLHAVTRIANRS